MLSRFRFSIIGIVLVGILLYVAVAQPSPSAVLRQYRNADPRADALEAVRRGDFRLVGVYGRGLMLPGADSILGWEGAMACAVRVVPYTSDAPKSDVEQQIYQVGMVYAREYNMALLAQAPGGRCTPSGR